MVFSYILKCNPKAKLEKDLPLPEELLCPKPRPVSPDPGTSLAPVTSLIIIILRDVLLHCCWEFGN